MAAFWPIGTAQIIRIVSYPIWKKSRFWLFCMWSVKEMYHALLQKTDYRGKGRGHDGRLHLPRIPHLHVNRPFTPCCKSQPEWTFKNLAIDESHWLFLTLTKIQTNKLVLNFKPKNLDSSSLSFCGCSGRTRKIKNNTKQSLWMSVDKRLSCCKSIYTWIYLPDKLFTNLRSLERDQKLELS